MSTEVAFPELADERIRLAVARASRDRMIERLEGVDPASAADEFFGRIDTSDHEPSERWYIGRRHIEDDAHEPVVVDWRAPIAAPFYRATAADPLGVDLRRRFTMVDGDLTAYLDEQLDDPDAADVAGGIPDSVLAEIGATRTGAMREIVATIQAEQDLVIRAPIDQVLVVQGGPGTGKTAVALHRAAYLMFEHRRRLAREGILVIGPNRAFLDYIANVLPSLGERSVRQCTVLDLCVPKIDIAGVDEPAVARDKGAPAMLDRLAETALAVVAPPGDDVVVPIGARRVVFIVAEVAADPVLTPESGHLWLGSSQRTHLHKERVVRGRSRVCRRGRIRTGWRRRGRCVGPARCSRRRPRHRHPPGSA